MPTADAVPPMSSAFRRAVVLAGVAALVFTVWVGADGRWDLPRGRGTTDFFDHQARALLHGRLSIPAEVAGIEGYDTPNGTQLYFGVFPALLRLPIVAATDRFDGRLAPLMGTLALALALVGTARLVWAVRTRWLGDDEPTSRERLLAAGMVLLVGVGSPLFGAAIVPLVYTEAILWGAALAIVFADAMVRLLVAPTTRRAAWAGFAAGACLLSRVTVGAGAMAALALVVGCAWFGRGTDEGSDAGDGRLVRAVRWSVGDPDRLRSVRAALAISLVVPALAYAGVNMARFGHPWRVPYDAQVAYRAFPERAEAFAANGGTLFGPGFVPTNAIAYLRPDALHLGSPFPYATLRDEEMTVELAGGEHDFISPYTSIPTGMTAFLVLGLTGFVALRRDGRRAWPVRAVTVGSAIGAGTILVYAVLAQRFLGDVMPLAVVLGAMGLARWAAQERRGHRPGRAAAVAVAAAALWTLWVNIGIGLSIQRIMVPVDREELAGWGRQVTDADGLLRRDAGIPVVDRLPEPTIGGRVALAGCARAYFSNGYEWAPIETGPDEPVVRALVAAPTAIGEVRVVARAGADGPVLALERSEWNLAVVRSTDGGATWKRSPTDSADPRPGRDEVEVRIDMDGHRGYTEVSVAGQVELLTSIPDHPYELVGDPAIEPLAPEPTPICDRWLRGS